MEKKTLLGENVRAMSDADLIDLITVRRAEFDGTLLAEIEGELRTRNLAPEQWRLIRRQIAGYQYERRVGHDLTAKKDESLPFAVKVLAVLFGGLFFPFAMIAAVILRVRGFNRMSLEVFLWGCVSLAISLALYFGSTSR